VNVSHGSRLLDVAAADEYGSFELELVDNPFVARMGVRRDRCLRVSKSLATRIRPADRPAVGRRRWTAPLQRQHSESPTPPT